MRNKIEYLPNPEKIMNLFMESMVDIVNRILKDPVKKRLIEILTNAK
jgi:hypothetical protein